MSEVKGKKPCSACSGRGWVWGWIEYGPKRMAKKEMCIYCSGGGYQSEPDWLDILIRGVDF